MQNTRQSHRSMLSNGEYKITLKCKQSMASLPRLDFFAFKPRQGEKYVIENGLLSNRMFAREKRLTNIFIMLLAVDTLLLYLHYELTSLPILGPFWLPLSCGLHLFATIVYALVLYLRHEENAITRRENNSAVYSWVLVGAFLAVHPLPVWGDTLVELTYDDANFNNLTFTMPVNHLIMLLTLLKNEFLMLTKQLVNSRFLNPRSKRLKNLFSVDLTQEMYAVKCMFQESPIWMFATFYLAGYLFFSFAFRITESSVPVDFNPFIYLENCFWFTIITSSTVGYGDMRIYSHVGYILVICCMIWGTLTTSCILAILTNTLALNSKEELALSSLSRVGFDLEYSKLCKHYMRECIWRLWTNRKYGKDRQESLEEKRMRRRLSKLRSEKKMWDKMMYNPSKNIAELSQREFSTCIESADVLRGNNVVLLNFIGSHMFSEGLTRNANYAAFKSESFIDRSMEKKLEDNIVEEETSLRPHSRASRDSQSSHSSQSSQVENVNLLQSVSSLSSESNCQIPPSRLSALRPNKVQRLEVQRLQIEDLRSHPSNRSNRSAIKLKEEGI